MEYGVVINTMRGVKKAFLDNPIFLILYPFVLGLGLLIKLLLSEKTYEQLKESYWVSDQNIINKTFADHGLNIFITCCCLIFIARVFVRELQDIQAPLLPTSHSRKTRTINKVKKTLKLALPYLARYALTYFLLLLFSKLKNYESVKTGGQCQPRTSVSRIHSDSVSSFLSKRSLKIACAPDEQWVAGSLNISGHYAFLGTLSLSLIYELKIFLHASIDSIENSFEEQDDDSSLSLKLKTAIALLVTITSLTFIVILIWCGVLTVTAIFYHTLQEKIMGLTFAYVAPVLNYVILTRFYNA